MKITLESFITVLKRSGLIPPDRAAALLEAFRAEHGDTNNGQAFADYLIQQNLLTNWQAEKLLQGKHKGFFLGKYRLLSLLGKGGMSSVYLAEHVLMRRRCAIKVLPAKRVNDTSYLGRFHREAQAVAALDHPNIVRAYDVDHEQDGNVEIHFLVMEYVNGASLLDLVNRNGLLSPVAAAEYIRQAALGLEHAHRAGLIHRDIKPGNLLVDSDGVVKVMDLGLARFFDGEDKESLTLQYDEKVLGTADYLAPEQAVDSHKIDARADLYSLGCTLYFLLVGHPPFPEGTLPQRLMAHQNKEPPPVEAERAGVPAELIDIMKRMMAKQPADRFTSAGAVAEALTHWLEQHGGDEWEQMRCKLTGAGVDAGGSSSRIPANKAPEAPRVAAAPAPAAAPVPAAPADELGAFLSRLSTDEPAPTLNVSSRTSARPPAGRKSAPRPEPVTDVVEAVIAEPVAPSPPKAAPPQVAPPKVTPPKVVPGAGAASAPPVAPARPAAPTASARRPIPVAAPVEVAEAEPLVAEALDAEPVEAAAVLPLKRKHKAALPTRYLVYGGAAALLLVGILITWLVWSGGGEEPAPAAVTPVQANAAPALPAPPAIPVRKLPDSPTEVTVGPDGNFATISDAIAYALANPPLTDLDEPRLIKVAGGQSYDERIVINNWNLGALHIKSEGDQRATLKPSGSDPVISVGTSRKVKIEGFRVDATDKAVAVHLTGVLNGVLLQNLEVSGFSAVGIDGDRASGLRNGRLELRDLVIRSSRPTAVGVRLAAPEETLVSGGIEVVTLANVTVAGPLAVGLDLSGLLRQVTVQRCRLHELQTGIRLNPQSGELDRLNIENNTFHRVGRAIEFQSLPSALKAVTLNKNLFAEVSGAVVEWPSATDAAAIQSLLPGATATFNATDRSPDTLAGAPWDLFATSGKTGLGMIDFASTEPGTGDFLKPRREDLRAPQATGADKFIGAVAP